MTFQGAWNPATAYNTGDVVTAGGYTFTATAGNTNQDPTLSMAPPSGSPLTLVGSITSPTDPLTSGDFGGTFNHTFSSAAISQPISQIVLHHVNGFFPAGSITAEILNASSSPIVASGTNATSSTGTGGGNVGDTVTIQMAGTIAGTDGPYTLQLLVPDSTIGYFFSDVATVSGAITSANGIYSVAFDLYTGSAGSGYSGPWEPTLYLGPPDPAGPAGGGSAIASGSMYLAPVGPTTFDIQSGATASGTLSLVGYVPQGSFDDFGFWVAGQPDSAMSILYNWVNYTDTAWERPFIAASAPQDYFGPNGSMLWLGAKYVSAGAIWTGVQEKHYYDNAQIESMYSQNVLNDNASNHENGSCYASGDTALSGKVQTSTLAAYSGSSSLQVTAPEANGVFPTLAGLAPMTIATNRVSGSLMIAHPRAGAQVGVSLSYFDANFKWLGTSIPGSTTAFTGSNINNTPLVSHPGGMQWIQVEMVDTPSFSNPAMWVGVTPYVSSTGQVAGEQYYSDMHMIFFDGSNYIPSAWESAQQTKIAVEADRINWMLNPGTASADTSTFGLTQSGGTLTFDSTQYNIGTNGSVKVDYPYNATPPTTPPYMGIATNVFSAGAGQSLQPTVSLLPVGQWYTFSQWVRPNPTGCPSVYLGVSLGGITSASPYINYTEGVGTAYVLANHGSDTNYVNNGWVRIWVTAFVPATSNGVASILTYVKATEQISATPSIWWVDNTMVEQGQALLPYFDGDSPGADYMWEATGTVYGRSHFYRDFNINKYRLDEIVRQNLPVGANYEILYGQPQAMASLNPAVNTAIENNQGQGPRNAAGTAAGFFH